MNFRSDNIAAVAEPILAAIVAANARSEGGYGADEITGRLKARFSELFEREVAVLPTLTGTAANALALAALVPAYGAIYCHREAHINKEECGAPEFFTGGAKLIALSGPRGKIEAQALRAALARGGTGDVHYAQPAALSLTQETEEGAVYRPEEVAELAAIARAHGLAVHMDGARFANAVAALGCAPADLTWRLGVDALSFGATKNGALAAEAIVLFRPELAMPLAFRHKRAGQLVAKMRFVAAQLEAYLADGLWLSLARHANAMAHRLSDGLAALPGAELVGAVQGNEVFVSLPESVLAGLERAGVGFYRWPESDAASRTIRLVAAHDTTPDEVEAFLETTRRLLTECGGRGL
ncbi:MAG TPA: beta-eliminating lyase-related protein [Alphaproteobacteria bacterium]|nr:beta-eliminating lyase-related protein [Alphaproteobacteria bacterium]